MWTWFSDMHSGGGRKEDFEHIYIEAPEDIARVVFYNRFGHNPERVTCTCCGDDYSIYESKTLEDATAYERGCRYDKDKDVYVDEPNTEYSYKKYQTLDEYKKNKSVLFIDAAAIADRDKVGDVPDEGYIWV